MFWKTRKRENAPSQSGEHIKGRILRNYINLGVKVEQLVQQRNWGESRRYVEANPELMSPGVESVFDSLSEMHRDAGPRVVEAIEEHRQLLRRCREQGVEAAFQRYVRRTPGR
jgi:hypothetical protein